MTDVPVSNHTEAIISLAWTEPPPERPSVVNKIVPRVARSHPLLPGFNLVPKSVLEAARVAEHPIDNVTVGVDPRTLPPFEAGVLVDASSNAAALQRWADGENRPQIKAKIATRLAVISELRRAS